MKFSIVNKLIKKLMNFKRPSKDNDPICSVCNKIGKRILQQNLSIEFVNDKKERDASIVVPRVQIISCEHCAKETVDKFSLSKIKIAQNYTRALNKDTCWICQTEDATTSEHKYKKSSFQAIHGRSYISDPNGPVRYSNENFKGMIEDCKKIQGPGAEVLKFKKSICSECNNKATQQADLAFDEFFEYVQKDNEQIVSSRLIDFEVCYGNSYSLKTENLHRYFSKLLGCWMRESGLEPPLQLSEYVLGSKKIPQIVCEFYLHDQIVKVGKARKKLFGHGGLKVISSPTRFQQELMVGGIVVVTHFFPDDYPNEYDFSTKKVKLGIYSKHF